MINKETIQTKERESLISYLPKDKHDLAAVATLINMGFERIEPIIPDLLTWVQDMNWPIATPLADFFISVGRPLEPYLLPILNSSKDDIWRYWVICSILNHSRELTEIEAIKTVLHRLASSPTAAEKLEELNLEAQNLIQKFDLPPEC